MKTTTSTLVGAMLGIVLVGACGDPRLPAEPTAPPSTPSFVTPTISFVAPTSGPAYGGRKIHIEGSGFQTGATVQIGTVAATEVEVYRATTIIALAPPHIAGQVDVIVTNPDGGIARLALGFRYFESPAPSAEPLRIRRGESVTGINDGDVPCTFESVQCRRLTVDAPAIEHIELELTVLEGGQMAGLFLDEPFLAPKDYPNKLTVAGGKTVLIMGDWQILFKVTAR